MQPGERIGPYAVVGVLGRGGMGLVLEVRHPDVPRRLALKLIDPAGADAEGLQRFAREGQALARVRHPGVVAVHGAGFTARGAPYLVMDLIEGEPLREQALEPRRAAALVRDLADAVAAVHQAGLVHRDLKPANVVLRDDGRPVLLDLGLARAVDVRRLTATGAIVGTPAYMSPEQAEGLPADARADVYGLGAVLYALLTGRAPFSSEGHGTFALLNAVIQRDPAWPRTLVAAVPPALDDLVRRAMAKRPDARHPSAEALRDELSAFLEGRPAAGPRRRAPSLLAAGVAAVAALVALAAATVVRTRRPAPSLAPPAPVVTESTTPTEPARELSPAPPPPRAWEQRPWDLEQPFPRARIERAMTYDPVRRQVLLFGGIAEEVVHRDLWGWNGRWREVRREEGQTWPPGRMGAALAFDAARRRLVLFAGAPDVEGDQPRADLWTWDGEAWDQVTPSPGQAWPEARVYHSMTWDAVREVVLLVGGRGQGRAALGDAWTWDGERWTRQRAPFTPRWHVGLTYDPRRDLVIVHGGVAKGAAFTDTWEQDGRGWVERTPAAGERPGPLKRATLVHDGGRALLFGGIAPDERQSDVLWAWDGERWEPLTLPGDAPSARESHGMAWDPHREMGVLFGGWVGSAENADTWELVR